MSSSLPQEISDRQAQADKLEALFRSRPLEEIEPDELRTITPHYQQRISCELRKRGMRIVNVPRYLEVDGRRKKRDGAYRFDTHTPLGRDSGTIEKNDGTRCWLVWSFEHNAWWGPDNCGYYTELRAAGLYTEAEAKEIERAANYGRERNEEARHIDTEFDAIMLGFRSYSRLRDVLLAAPEDHSVCDAVGKHTDLHR